MPSVTRVAICVSFRLQKKERLLVVYVAFILPIQHFRDLVRAVHAHGSSHLVLSVTRVAICVSCRLQKKERLLVVYGAFILPIQHFRIGDVAF